jgi:hypothetical protein
VWSRWLRVGAFACSAALCVGCAGWQATALNTAKTWAKTGSLYRSQHTHVGIRPSFDSGVAVEVRVTTDKMP